MISDERVTLFLASPLSSCHPSGSVLDEADSNYPQLATSPQSMDSALTTGDGKHLSTALETKRPLHLFLSLKKKIR